MVAVRCGLIAIGVHLAIAALIGRSDAGRHHVVFGVLPNPLDVDLASPEIPTPAPPSLPAPPADLPPAPPARAIPIVHQATPTPSAPSIASSDATHPTGGLTSNDGLDVERKDPPTIIGTASSPPAPAPPPPPPPPPPVVVDRSTAAKLRRTTNWDCPWPPEADADQIDEAYVVLTVYVDANGRATNVSINDPGHGFGREARKCAMRELYTPGTDRDGRAIPTITKPFRVHFAR